MGRRSGEVTQFPSEITERPAGSLPGVAASHPRRRTNPTEQLGAKPGRRRPKEPFPEMLRAFIDEARQRHRQRPASPGVNVEPVADGYRLESPHRDLEAWAVQICDSFGTRSYSTFSIFLDQLAQLCTLVRDKNGELVPSELELNAALNIVSGVRPRNEMEAALAAQMVAVHFMTMRVASQALHTNWTDPRTTAIAGKLARTFAMQSDAMTRLKGRTGKQTIRVRYERHDHRHVHVGEGGAEKGTQGEAPCAPRDQSRALEHQPREPGAPLRRQD
jgi:hypothetical protein